MKGFVKKFALVALAVLLFSMVAGYAYASTKFLDINKYTAGGSYVTVSNRAIKSDATPCVVALYNSGFASQYRVRIFGRDLSGDDTRNCTYYNNTAVNYVVCNTGTYYAVSNLVNERAYSYCDLSIMPLGGNGITTGEWSTDSFTYKDHAAPESAG